MLRFGTQLTAGLGLLVLGQTGHVPESIPYADVLASGGALGILGWAIYWLLRNTQIQQKQFSATIERQQASFTATLDAMAERHERWEKIRHDDAVRLASGLNKLSSNCAAVNGMKDTPPP